MPELWKEDIKWQPDLEIDAASYNEWVLELFPQIKDMKPATASTETDDVVPLGLKVFYVRELPTHKQGFWGSGPFAIPRKTMVRMTLLTVYGSKRGEVSFTDVVKIPILAQATRPREVWMSLSPMEIMTQRPGIRKAKGRVLVGGMGMGWFARRVLERKKVTHVTVCDIDKFVLDYFGNPLKEEFGDKLTLVKGDVYEQKMEDFDSVLLDIWQDLGDAKYDKKYKALAEWHRNVWAWGG